MCLVLVCGLFGGLDDGKGSYFKQVSRSYSFSAINDRVPLRANTHTDLLVSFRPTTKDLLCICFKVGQHQEKPLEQF